MPRLVLELDVGDPHSDSPTVRGTVHEPDGTDTPFMGWVGLLALLQRALGETTAS